MRRNISFSLILLFAAVSVMAQNPDKNADRKDKVRRTDKAKADIRKLKDGTLLVMLKRNAKKAEALRKAGNETAAVNHEKEQHEKHLEIAKGFKENFTFSKVYFFYNTDLNEMKASEAYGDYVMDANLNKLTSVVIDTSKLFILNSSDVPFKYHGDSKIGFGMHDRKMNLLERPFPYYVRKREGIPFFKRSYEEMVMKLEQQLAIYYGS